MTFDERLLYYQDITEKQIKKYMDFSQEKQDRLFQAMRYSTNAGGKRIRPVLALEFGRVCGGSIDAALPAACAIEMMHTFSLIHDDLPCMDNDDIRRGRASCHRAFDEATALLAGDALEMYPFEILTDCANYGVKAENVIEMIRLLAEYAGHKGMIGGQQIDTQFVNCMFSEDDLLEMYRLKTSRLLQAAACMGCLSAGADIQYVQRAYEYGDRLGLAFQIVDDILDICGNEDEVGKPVGSDEKKNKMTFAAVAGISAAKEKARQLTDEAFDLLNGFEDSGFLKQLTLKLLNRNK